MTDDREAPKLPSLTITAPKGYRGAHRGAPFNPPTWTVYVAAPLSFVALLVPMPSPVLRYVLAALGILGSAAYLVLRIRHANWVTGDGLDQELARIDSDGRLAQVDRYWTHGCGADVLRTDAALIAADRKRRGRTA